MRATNVRRDYDYEDNFYQIFVGFTHDPVMGYDMERVEAGILLKREDGYDIDNLSDAGAIELAKERFKDIIDGKEAGNIAED